MQRDGQADRHKLVDCKSKGVDGSVGRQWTRLLSIAGEVFGEDRDWNCFDKLAWSDLDRVWREPLGMHFGQFELASRVS